MNTTENLTKTEMIIATIAREGGYIDDKDDLGGETNMGITHITWAKYGDDTPLKDITKGQAVTIYDKQFYQKQLIDNVRAIYPSVANNFFDASVNCGRCGATKILQQQINGFFLEHQRAEHNILEDGYIGKKTLDAMTLCSMLVSDNEFENDFRQGLHEHYLRLVEIRPVNIKYLKGWVNRLMEVY